ncbi:MAG: hypothetical protein ACRDUV_23085 [Pseudonocardiaceae bacterium]
MLAPESDDSYTLLLRAAVRCGPDDLFLVGDTHQHIYDHRVSLKQIGIDIAGRFER